MTTNLSKENDSLIVPITEPGIDTYVKNLIGCHLHSCTTDGGDQRSFK